MRRGKTVSLAALLAVCLTACTLAGRAVNSSDEILAKDEAAETVKEAATETVLPENTAAANVKESRPAVTIGLLAEIDQDGESIFNRSAWSGLQRAEEELEGVLVKRLDAQSEGEYADNLKIFAEDRYDLVVISGHETAEALSAYSTAYPKLAFAVMDEMEDGLEITGNSPMVIVRFEPSQISYLAGVAAGMMTETGRVGWIVGDENERTAAAGYGYLSGVLDANPKAVILQANIRTFHDREAGRAAARRMAEEGADVLFHEAGSSGLGVIQGGQESGVKVIGMDYDQSTVASGAVVASGVKQMEQAVYDVARECADGTLESGVRICDLKNGGCDFLPARVSSEQSGGQAGQAAAGIPSGAEGKDASHASGGLPEEVLTALQTVKEKLKNGEITVPVSKEEFEAAYGEVYLLD